MTKNDISEQRTPKGQNNWSDWEFRLLQTPHKDGVTAEDMYMDLDNRSLETTAIKASKQGYPLKRKKKL